MSREDIRSAFYANRKDRVYARGGSNEKKYAGSWQEDNEGPDTEKQEEEQDEYKKLVSNYMKRRR